ncbi:MAG: hypothetical protein N3E36_07265 [Sulfolobales archaeon]|nr:aldehyde ferredoxin oxidoreductase [Ignisphaera sp.]MCX8199790.1 hypothetical protein [Sulfolobales archaeon]MDW8084971.1 aldehyde ferredoxin oxidoreductase N-terminal domain-containing protein [Ignisphaera sp.]
MLDYKVLRIDVGTGKWVVESYRASEVLGPIDAGITIHEKLQSWSKDVFDPSNAVVIGSGLFAGSKLFGTHRLVAVFRSPETKGLHVSAMGGAAYRFIGCGVNAISIEGRSEKPAIIIVRGGSQGIEGVEIIHIQYEELEKVYSGYKGKIGAYALIEYILDTYRDVLSALKARPIVVGPASWRTIYGALISIDINFSKMSITEGSEDFAARGGVGSVLAQAHNVAAIIAGGNYKPQLPATFTDATKLYSFLATLLGKDYASSVNEATVKYRFDPKIGSGGTFGVNYPHYRELLPLFNYNSIYLTKLIRKKIVDLLLENFWKPFKVEISNPKTWTTCGEPCPAACKKVWLGKKTDYEPFNGLGPMIGVMKLELAAKLVDLADQLGFDAITIGHVVAWLLEAVYRGLLTPEEIALDRKPVLDPMLMNVDEWSKNAELAEKILWNLVNGSSNVLKTVAVKGIRAASKYLDEVYIERVKRIGVRFEDIVVYQPYGDDGYMTPNYYWTPGLLLPIPITGKYWTNYTSTFTEPEEFAKTVVVRIMKEYGIENAGFCRFHRGWSEKILGKLYGLLGIEVDVDNHSKEMYKRIAVYNIKAGAKPKLIEGARAKDVIVTLAYEFNVTEWGKKFSENYDETLKEWITKATKVIIEQLDLPPSWIKE